MTCVFSARYSSFGLPPGSPHSAGSWSTTVSSERDRVSDETGCLYAMPAARGVGPIKASAEAVAIAWSAQRRLHRTWARLEARNKRRTIIAVAAARELVGFCWAITQIE